MNKKVCTRCQKKLTISQFRKNWDKRQKKYYLKAECIDCSSKLFKNWRKKNLQYVKEYDQEYRVENKSKLTLYRKERYSKNKEFFLEEYKKWYKKNKKYKSEYNSQYLIKHQDRILPIAKERSKQWRKDVRKDPLRLSKSRKWRREYRLKRKEEPHYAIWERLRARIISWNKRTNRETKEYLMTYVGCSKIFLKEYIALQFINHLKDGKKMSFKNYSEWHIDHIVPLNVFKNQNDYIKNFSNHFLNLRPLWAEENQKKSARVIKNTSVKKLLGKIAQLANVKDVNSKNFKLPYFSGKIVNGIEDKISAKILAKNIFSLSFFDELNR